jgi:hypothetical protein
VVTRSVLVVAMIATSAYGRPRSGAASACAQAAEEGQQERDASKLLNARASFGECAVEQCPKEVRRDCQRWLEELRPVIPSVVIAVQNAQGQDVPRYALRVDGEIVVPSPGRPIELDPGNHQFRVSADNMAPSVSTFTVHEGEHRRMVRVVLQPEAGNLPGRLDGRAPEGASSASSTVPAPIAYGLTALGGALAITGVALYGVTTARADEVDAECRALGANCEVQNRDTLGARKTWGVVLTVAGVATLATGLYFVLAGRPSAAPAMAMGRF